MKKFLLSLTIITCIAAIALGIYTNQNQKKESDLTIQIIEALARVHGGGGDGGLWIPCSLQYQYDDEGFWWQNCIFCDVGLKGWHEGVDYCLSYN